MIAPKRIYLIPDVRVRGSDMKILRMFATAGLVIASLGATTAASATDHDGNRHYQSDRGDRGDRDYRGDRGDHRGDRRDWNNNRSWRSSHYNRHDNGHHYGWRNNRGYGRCHIEWRHHRQIRICR